MIFLVAWVAKLKNGKREAEYEAKVLAWVTGMMSPNYCQHRIVQLTEAEVADLGWLSFMATTERVYRCESCGCISAVPEEAIERVWLS